MSSFKIRGIDARLTVNNINSRFYIHGGSWPGSIINDDSFMLFTASFHNIWEGLVPLQIPATLTRLMQTEGEKKKINNK